MKTVRSAYYMNMTTQPSNKFIRSINVDREVWARAQALAAKRSRSLSSVIELALTAYLETDDGREADS